MKNTLIKQLTEAKKERDNFKSKFTVCFDKFSHLLTRNVNKKINTQKNHVALRKQTVDFQEETI